MAYLPDFSATQNPLDKSVVDYLSQIVDNPRDPDANKQKLRWICIFFEDQAPRYFSLPTIVPDEQGYVGGESDNIPCSVLVRSDSALSIIYKQADPDDAAKLNTVAWAYTAGIHSRV